MIDTGGQGVHSLDKPLFHVAEVAPGRQSRGYFAKPAVLVVQLGQALGKAKVGSFAGLLGRRELRLLPLKSHGSLLESRRQAPNKGRGPEPGSRQRGR